MSADTAATFGRATAAEPRSATLRGAIRRRRIWIAFAIVLLVGGGALILLRGFGGVGGQALGAANPSPAGAKAVVQVLRGQGVEVTEARSHDRAVDAGTGATVLVYDELALLGDEQLGELASAADRLVVVEPDFAALRAIAPGVRHAGAASGPIDEAGCALPEASRAGELSDGQRLFTVDDASAADGWTGCFRDDSGAAFALVTGPADAGGAEIVLVGSSAIFANGTIDEAGNAALALGLTGADRDLVWYLPSPADAEGEGPTLAELTPGWVSPVLVLAVAVTIAAGVWRGRRFGRLVVEDLPVEVRAGETVDGRARLYAGASARTHALDQLRIGTIGRLVTALRLPRAAPAGEVAALAASTIGAEPGDVRRVLIDATPAGDRELVELARELDELEQRVRAAVASGPPTDPDASGSPTGRRP